MKSPEKRLVELGFILPAPPKAAGSYSPYVRTGSLVFVSGMLPRKDNTVIAGAVGEDTSLELAQEAARLALLSALSALKAELGDLGRIVRVVRLTGYVRSHKGFSDQHKVMDGASDLLREVLGEKGVHSRVSIGVSELPLNAVLELELVVEAS